MTDSEKKVDNTRVNVLRQKAERLLTEDPQFASHPRISDLESLLHELQVHQIELEIQNEELLSARAALEKSKKKYLDLYNLAPVAFLRLSAENSPTILQANAAACQLLGFSLRPGIPYYFSVFAAPKDRGRFYDHISKVISSRKTKVCELQLQSAEKRELFAVVHTLPITDKDGSVCELLMAVADLTDLKQAESERQRIESELRQAQKMEAIGTLAGGIAHDFNNVLGIIVGNIELAKDDTIEGNPARYSLNEAYKACLRAKEMVKQILAFSREDKKEQRPIDIRPVIKEALNLLRSSIPTTIEIQQDIPSKKMIILGDPTQIHQVLLNLCTNAADAMEEMPSVLQVRLASIDLDKEAVKAFPELTAGRHIRLTVSDTGQGMNPEVLEQIFDPYFTTKEVGKGTGMGLAVVHGIVKGHNGVITVYSEKGRGTTFHVFFPELERPLEEHAKSVDTIPRGTERILFVDDEVPLAKLGKRMLESLGYKVESRTSSIGALELFRSKPDQFDLIVTDMTMPNMTGEVFAKEVMQTSRDIPIVLCTGFSHQISEEKATAIGIKGFAMKPLVKSELAKIVRHVLDG